MKNRFTLCIFFSLLFLSGDISWAEPLKISSEGISFNPTNPRSRGISIFTEASSKLDVEGVSKAWLGRNEHMRAEIAISISRLNYKQAPSDFRRSKYYPVYGLFNIQMNYNVAPFAQFGVDLGEALAVAIMSPAIIGGDGLCCDTNITVGLQGTLFRKILLSAYGKLYMVSYGLDDVHVSRKDYFAPVAGIRFSYLY